MKKKIAIVLVAIITGIILGSSIIYFYKIFSTKKEEKQILNKTYELIEMADDSLIDNSSEFNNKSILLKDDMIGVLLIPKVNVEAPIKDGTSQEVMKTSIGHFIESDYWNGNVSLASHNGGVNAHYFENLKQLEINDEIEYLTKYGRKKYRVKEIKNISSHDWSEVISNNKSKNTITLITCIDSLPNYRLCVKGIEV